MLANVRKATKMNLYIEITSLLRPPETGLKGDPNGEVPLYNISDTVYVYDLVI